MAAVNGSTQGPTSLQAAPSLSPEAACLTAEVFSFAPASPAQTLMASGVWAKVQTHANEAGWEDSGAASFLQTHLFTP